jgi:hypothetical protein
MMGDSPLADLLGACKHNHSDDFQELQPSDGFALGVSFFTVEQSSSTEQETAANWVRKGSQTIGE